jgi:hypothetical protein
MLAAARGVPGHSVGEPCGILCLLAKVAVVTGYTPRVDMSAEGFVLEGDTASHRSVVAKCGFLQGVL